MLSLRQNDSFDFLAFTPADHSHLLWMLSNAPNFFSSKIPLLISEDHRLKVKVHLRLDRHFLFYGPSGPGEFKLVEHYAIKGDLSVSRTVGTWGKVVGFRAEASLNIFDRRGDLCGAVLRNGLLPYLVLTDVVLNGSAIVSADGMFQDVLHHLEDNLNFTTAKIKPQDDGWGQENPDGTWQGLVGMLKRHELDISTGKKS